MGPEIGFSVLLCVVSLAFSASILRSRHPSLGLPFAYLAILTFNHVPGAIAHIARPELFTTTYFVGLGIWQTAVASLCFCLGLFLCRACLQSSLPRGSRRQVSIRTEEWGHGTGTTTKAHFLLFCLLGGWSFIYVLTPFHGIPTLGAIIEKGGAVWMLGVMIGLRDALLRSDFRSVFYWASALAVYPTLMLLLGGFLSYGSAATIIVLSILVVSGRSYFRVVIGASLIAVLGISLFTNYFLVRDEIRSVVWSSASFSERVDVLTDNFGSMTFFSFSNDEHATALDERLNQNYFSGLAASNLDNGVAKYRYFQQLYEALISPIPRALWPDKPVFGGSGYIVRDMTGLTLSDTTSWGVGQVMELYISFGWSSLVVGFLVLGWTFGRLDCAAALAERRGDIKTLFACFLPAVALAQPLGSLVEIVGGAFAAFLAALGWNLLWPYWIRRQNQRRPPAHVQR